MIVLLARDPLFWSGVFFLTAGAAGMGWSALDAGRSVVRLVRRRTR